MMRLGCHNFLWNEIQDPFPPFCHLFIHSLIYYTLQNILFMCTCVLMACVAASHVIKSILRGLLLVFWQEYWKNLKLKIPVGSKVQLFNYWLNLSFLTWTKVPCKPRLVRILSALLMFVLSASDSMSFLLLTSKWKRGHPEIIIFIHFILRTWFVC